VNTDRLLTADEVAEFLNVPTTWVRSETRAERMPHVKLGKYRRYRLDDVVAWLENKRGGSTLALSSREGGSDGKR
jgi:excisionase family DNA binding protein